MSTYFGFTLAFKCGVHQEGCWWQGAERLAEDENDRSPAEFAGGVVK